MANDKLTTENVNPQTLTKLVAKTNMLRGPQEQYDMTAVDLYKGNVPLVRSFLPALGIGRSMI